MATACSARVPTATLTLLILLASSQVTHQASYDGTPNLQFVQQLTIRGCPVFVHDTGRSLGPHLAVEPIMCVTESLDSVRPRYDPVIQQTYVSVPVMLRDDAMLEEVERHLTHLSPKSVKFATVTDISVSTDNSSVIEALGFDWKFGDSMGVLRIGCKDEDSFFCRLRFEAFKHKSTLSDLLQPMLLTTRFTSGEGGRIERRVQYRLAAQNARFLHSPPDSHIAKSAYPSRFVRSIVLNNCTAKIHERVDTDRRHYLIEPLLCHNITAMTNESVLYDYSIDKHYLKLELVLQDEATVDAVRTQLADLKPRSVNFMRLWGAQSSVAPALSRRFVIGPLMVSGDWKSAQVRVYCKTENECENLRQSTLSHPYLLWRQLRWWVSSILLANDACIHPPVVASYMAEFPTTEEESSSWNSRAVQYFSHRDWVELCSARLNKTLEGTQFCRFTTVGDRKTFVIIQQRLNGRESFQRTWDEYERGFGDESDFWIGLKAIHSISSKATTLRIEMKLWNGTELRVEYIGFRVENSTTKYSMFYKAMVPSESNVAFDVFDYMYQSRVVAKFSTIDNNNDAYLYLRCSATKCGNSGWWFADRSWACCLFHPHGAFGGRNASSGMVWPGKIPEFDEMRRVVDEPLALRSVRLMLQI